MSRSAGDKLRRRTGRICRWPLFLLGFVLATPVGAQPSPAALRSALLHSPAHIPSFSTEAASSSETARDTAALNPSPEPWLALDKAQHATISFFWTLGSQYALVNKLAMDEGSALPLSVAAAATAGLAKEWYDARHGNPRRFSRRDLVADAFGIVLAAGLILL